jgi:hypothetical protein
MSANITPSLRSALERLRHGGAVNGILLGWRRQVLINALPFEEFRAEKLLLATHDLRDHFRSGGDRLAHTFWFGFESCHALVIHQGECTLVILHVRTEEADFLRRAGQTFLDDCQRLIEGLLTPSLAEASAPGLEAGFL